MDCNLIGNVEKILATDGIYISSTKGVSMLPMIKTGRDVVVISPKKERLKRFDVALYRRGEAYVLHRVIEVLPDSYLIRGDNTYVDEFIPESAVIGVMTEYYRGRKNILATDKKYLDYVEKRVKSYPKRKKRYEFTKKFKSKIKKLLGKE